MKTALVLLLLWSATTPVAARADADPPWDFIVVGGGVAGCVAADILSASGRRTLLLESGPPGHAKHGGRDIPAAFASCEAAHGRNLTRFDIPGEYHRIAWKLPQYNQPSTPWAYQANVLGGGGVVNGALTMVPPQTDFSDAPWSFDDVDPHFKQLLGYMQAVNVPSADGLRYLEASSGILRRGLANMNFTAMPLNSDPDKRARTYSYPPTTAAEGQRVSTCLRFLSHAMARPNFKLITGAVAERIVFGSAGAATGVSFARTSTGSGSIDGRSEVAALAAQGRVVLTAGALNTPRLLMLSGVGPKLELEKLDAEGLAPPRALWVYAENVGAELSDHVYLRMRMAMPGYENFNYATLTNASIQQYCRSLSGPLAQYGPTLTGYLASPFGPRGGNNATDVADIEVFMEASDECVASEGAPTCRSDTFDVYLMLLSPVSKSNLTLNITARGTSDSSEDGWSGRVEVAPGNWSDLHLSAPEDRQVLRWGVEQVVRSMQAAHGADLELITPANASAAAIDALLGSFDDSHMVGNHWAQTCPLGKCTDPATLQVYGTANVHVADASLLHRQLSSHPVLTVAAMARKAAQDILISSGQAACAANPRCAAQGLKGQCCPSFDAVMLACCAFAD